MWAGQNSQDMMGAGGAVPEGGGCKVAEYGCDKSMDEGFSSGEGEWWMEASIPLEVEEGSPYDMDATPTPTPGGILLRVLF